MKTTEERIRKLQHTISSNNDQIKQLQEDIEVALIAMGKMEEALKRLKKKRWYNL